MPALNSTDDRDDAPVVLARTAQDHRVRFSAPPGAPPALRRILVAAVRARLGWPALSVSQDEAIAVARVDATSSGWTASFSYTLDRDFTSQYDRTETHHGACTLRADAPAAVTWVPPDPRP
ncbi:MAG: hypothetical protein IPL61_35895 [Myxococcales bacterium]|nr:hypothetical protein [Myxococcales bacterium]